MAKSTNANRVERLSFLFLHAAFVRELPAGVRANSVLQPSDLTGLRRG